MSFAEIENCKEGTYFGGEIRLPWVSLKFQVSMRSAKRMFKSNQIKYPGF